MDLKKVRDFAVPFLLTVSAVVVGLGIYKLLEKHFAKTAKKAPAKKEATKTDEKPEKEEK